jgi:hypothetical protein
MPSQTAVSVSFEVSHFESPEDIQSGVMTALKGLLENDTQWRYWNACINLGGEYFEGDCIY